MKLERAIWISILLAVIMTTTQAQEPSPTIVEPSIAPDVSALEEYGFFTEPICPNGATPYLLAISTLNNGRTWIPTYLCNDAFVMHNAGQ